MEFGLKSAGNLYPIHSLVTVQALVSRWFLSNLEEEGGGKQNAGLCMLLLLPLIPPLLLETSLVLRSEYLSASLQN